MDDKNDLYIDIVKLYFENGKSPTLVKKVLKKKYPDVKHLSRKQIFRIVTKFEQYGTIGDRRKDTRIRQRTGRSDENIEKVKTIIQETPTKSVRNVFREVDSNISSSSVYRILKYDLKFTPYKISIMQHLKDTVIWFSDEAHFTLDGHVNKQNMRFWGTSKPDFYAERPLHSSKITVWAALSSTGIIGPFFYEEDGETTTVTSQRYLTILKTKFLPKLRRRYVEMNNVWFQQDGATPHTAKIVLEWLAEKFGEHFISLRSNIEWPPHSPDLNPLDFFLWGYLKDRVYSPPPQDTSALKMSIRREIQRITVDSCKNVIRNFRDRMRLVTEKHGGHLEHVLK